MCQSKLKRKNTQLNLLKITIVGNTIQCFSVDPCKVLGPKIEQEYNVNTNSLKSIGLAML